MSSMITITKKYLEDNPDHVFVFGDNLIRKGYGGAAKLRDEPNAYGFVTKKYPNNDDESFYKPDEYLDVFNEEMNRLINFIERCPQKTFLVSPLGSGLANKYKIWEEIIKQNIIELKVYPNVKLLFKISH